MLCFDNCVLCFDNFVLCFKNIVLCFKNFLLCLQIWATVGTRLAPSYANLFLGKFEKQAIDNSLLKPFIWWRFVDIFMIWTHGEEHLKTFIGYLNSIHPSIKFTHEYSNSLHQTLPFLDVQVHLINNHMQTDLHTKPKDKHQYLLKTSCHTNHTKKAIPFSLFLRIRRICSNDTFFDQRSRELFEYLTTPWL